MRDISLIVCYNEIMKYKVISFFGHRQLFGNRENIRDKVFKQVKSFIVNDDVNVCIVGNHGEFDKMALSICIELKEKYKNIKINLAIANLTYLKKQNNETYNYFNELKNKGIEIVIYDIEEIYYKRKITETNRKIIEQSDIVICYVDESKIKSGAKNSYKYAKRLGKNVIIYMKKKIIQDTTKQMKKYN